MAIEKVTRFGDMHRTRGLTVYRQFGGDVVIAMAQNGETIGDGDIECGNSEAISAVIEFCINGGQSPNTLNALINLLEAMKLDNAEQPQDRS